MWRNWNLTHCLWDYKMMQPYRKTIFQFLKILNTELAYDSAILILAIYPREKKTYGHTKASLQMFITALFVIVKKWEQSKC